MGIWLLDMSPPPFSGRRAAEPKGCPLGTLVSGRASKPRLPPGHSPLRISHRVSFSGFIGRYNHGEASLVRFSTKVEDPAAGTKKAETRSGFSARPSGRFSPA